MYLKQIISLFTLDLPDLQNEDKHTILYVTVMINSELRNALKTLAYKVIYHQDILKYSNLIKEYIMTISLYSIIQAMLGTAAFT